MKTKELIRQLQESDPSGEMECVVENADIAFVHTSPAYWDGCYQKLIRNNEGEVIGGEYCSKGDKVEIRVCSISDAIFNYDEFRVGFDSEYAQKRYESVVEGYRETSERIKTEVAMNFFVAYMKRRLVDSFQESFEEDEVKSAAEDFFKKNMSHEDPMPEDIKSMKESWHQRRCLQWDKEITPVFVNNKLEFKKEN